MEKKVKRETYCVKVKKIDAENTRRKLISAGLLDHSFDIASSEDFIFFPVKADAVKNKHPMLEGLNLTKHFLSKRSIRPHSLAKLFESEGLPTTLTHSFDIIGNIAIVEIPKEITSKRIKEKEKIERKIAHTIMKIHPHIKTVMKKVGPVSGKYRIRKLTIIAGKKNSETVHKESGCIFKLDVQKVYFSPRLSFERQRISSLVKEGETVFVPFAGVGPFAIVIAKEHPDVKVYANELNPHAYRYLEENIKLNKTWNVHPLKGDARKVAEAFQHIADRVVMPIPMSAPKFIDVAFKLAKKGAVVHFYHFTDSKEGTLKFIKECAKRRKKRIEIMCVRKVRQYSPSINEYVVDFKIF